MSVLGHISIKWHPSPPPSHTLSILRSAGWQFVEETIWYEHYVNPEDIGNNLEAPVSEWQQVSALIDVKYQNGETVSVRLEYSSTDSDAWFYFRQEAEGIQEMTASLQEPRPRLCGRFTDFGWYLPKIVCPLFAAGHNILEITCNDDAY
jgi:hypothetical protein